MFKWFTSIFGNNTAKPKVEYRSVLHRILITYNVKELLELILHQPDDFKNEFAANIPFYYSLLNKPFLLHWKREYSQNPKLMLLHNALERFMDSGRFVLQINQQKVEFEVEKVIQHKVHLSTQKYFKEKTLPWKLLMLKVCVYFLTSGSYSPDQELVQEFDAFTETCIKNSWDDHTICNHSFMLIQLGQLFETFAQISPDYYPIVLKSLDEGTPKELYANKGSIEAKLDEFRNLSLLDTMQYYQAFLKERLTLA